LAPPIKYLKRLLSDGHHVIRQAVTTSCEEGGHGQSGPIDTLTISLNTARLVGEDIRAEAKLNSEIRNHRRQSWTPIDSAGGGS